MSAPGEYLPSRFYTCEKHGWDALGKPCPKCAAGDSPRICVRHGWSHATKGCPECAQGKNPLNLTHPRPMSKTKTPASKILGKHIKECAALREYKCGNWNTPWAGIPEQTRWLSSVGDNRGRHTPWLVIPCNDPSCSAKKLVPADVLSLAS